MSPVGRFLCVTIAVLGTSNVCGDTSDFRLHTINADSIFSACAVLDVNNDGQLDVVAGGYWYESPNWLQHFVRDVEVIRGRPDGYSHLPFDVNGDSYADLIHVNFRSRSIYWLEHPGAKPGEWLKHLVAEPGPMETGRLFDIDGDGRLDLLPNGWHFAAWWDLKPRSDSQGTDWIRHDIPQKAGGHGGGFGDINGDRRGDIVGTKGWLEAPIDRRSGTWIWHDEFDLGRTSMPIVVADVDDDGDGDLVYAIGHDYGVFWLEQRKSNGKRLWEKHLIDRSWSQGHSPLWADLNGNGRPEFIDGKRYWAHEGRDPGARDPLVIYRYEFDPASRAWVRDTIQENGPAGVGLDPKVADLDKDGDLDLVLPGRSGLYWYENLKN